MKQEIMRRTKSLRIKSDRKPGGQPGHDGHTLKMPDDIDRFENHHPDFCIKCETSLKDVGMVLEYIT